MIHPFNVNANCRAQVYFLAAASSHKVRVRAMVRVTAKTNSPKQVRQNLIALSVLEVKRYLFGFAIFSYFIFQFATLCNQGLLDSDISAIARSMKRKYSRQ